MLKAIVLVSLLSCVFAGVIHDYGEHNEHLHEPKASETDHHHKVEHEHATSHQSFKIHHFHPVPVYVKKEDQHFLKHPVEVGGVDHKLKQIHPETEKHHGHGLVLENHTSEKHHEHHHHKEHHEEPEVHHDFGVHEAPQHEPHINLHHQQLKQHDDGDGYGDESSHHQFHDINVHHGHYE